MQRIRNIVLTAASFVYLYFTDKWSIAVVIGLTLFSYVFGQLISKSKRRNLVHTIGVIGVLALLIVFKYLGFLTGIMNGFLTFHNSLPAFKIDKLILPLGISYIVFKHISYLTDIKWGLVKPGRFDDFLLYSSLFTIYVAGPIERFERFKPQVEQQRILFSWDDIDYGIMRIVFGMFKKLVIADMLGFYLSQVWKTPEQFNQMALLITIIGYSLQIYFDFAGYSDIAIGSSRLFGLKIMENFKNPYLAPNISQFWRRWHISLSDWIRDYMFFPLSRLGNRKWWLKLFVPVIAMALCGLWHGAAWNFVLWGIWHGTGLAIFQFWCDWKRRSVSLSKTLTTAWLNFTAIVINYAFVTLGWVIFATPRFNEFYGFLLGKGSAQKSMLSMAGLGFVVLGLLVVHAITPIYQKCSAGIPNKYKFYFDISVFVVVVVMMFNFAAGSSNFIYAGF